MKHLARVERATAQMRRVVAGHTQRNVIIWIYLKRYVATSKGCSTPVAMDSGVAGW